MMNNIAIILRVSSVLVVVAQLVPHSEGNIHSNPCRSYCGNLTLDYPFALRPGCGHPGFRDLLFCINEVLMLHIASGSYRVTDIDYAYETLTLHDPHMSTCESLVLARQGNGFALDTWRNPFLKPDPDNIFMLIGCSAQSPLFQGFPGQHVPCRNVSGMSCEEFYTCPAWDMVGHRRAGSGSGPPECCGVSFEAIRAVNLSRLECEGYSSAYSLAPLRVGGPGEWSYGIRVKYSVQGNDGFCGTCEATGGTCGYHTDGITQLCMCETFNSTSNCDSAGLSLKSMSLSSATRAYVAHTYTGILMLFLAWII